ncbi:slit homolog 2 protein-like [Mytilus trossulus]|uniref:slit homolog 2 protein-like n=1 Tax=Mytilus trossulus TaxID=6551 RepID=UPI0030078F5F
MAFYQAAFTGVYNIKLFKLVELETDWNKSIGMMLFNIIAVLTLSILQEGYAVPCTYPGLTMCDCIGTVIKCLEQNLTQIPSTIPKNTTGLPFQKNKISVIDDTSLSGLTSLKELILSYNEISIIEDGAFSDLQALKRLFLVSNKIDSLGTKLSGLTSLQNLDLSLNDISSIEDGEFSGLLSLETMSC